MRLAFLSPGLPNGPEVPVERVKVRISFHRGRAIALGIALCLLARAATGGMFRVTLLGTGNPRPIFERFGPSILLEAAGRAVLIDCGRAATIRLNQLGISSAAVEAVLLTHLHSDHIVGLPDLWLTGWEFGRTQPLMIVGPSGTGSFVRHLREAFAFDIHMRRDVDERLPERGVELTAREVGEGEALHTPEGLVVTTFAVEHGKVQPALGFRADFEGHSVVFSGDTHPSENLLRHAQGVDVLVHEVVSVDLERKEALVSPSMVEGIIARHTTVPQAAEIFERVHPKLAVYSHIVPSTAREEELVRETRARYLGPLAVGYDLMQLVITDHVEIVDRRECGSK